MGIEKRQLVLADALAAAMRDTFREWHRQNAKDTAADLAFAEYVKRLECSLQYAPGGRGWAVCEVVDRRPAKSVLNSYEIQALPHTARVRRKTTQG